MYIFCGEKKSKFINVKNVITYLKIGKVKILNVLNVKAKKQNGLIRWKMSKMIGGLYERRKSENKRKNHN